MYRSSTFKSPLRRLLGVDEVEGLAYGI
ncbi:hypothetical protein NC651_037931 [Populus alba x Populus x berolinensis]|nr:hypothetical protein NC651_037931 [Populus alba x Populus x berolinensis]